MDIVEIIKIVGGFVLSAIKAIGKLIADKNNKRKSKRKNKSKTKKTKTP